MLHKQASKHLISNMFSSCFVFSLLPMLVVIVLFFFFLNTHLMLFYWYYYYYYFTSTHTQTYIFMLACITYTLVFQIHTDINYIVQVCVYLPYLPFVIVVVFFLLKSISSPTSNVNRFSLECENECQYDTFVWLYTCVCVSVELASRQAIRSRLALLFHKSPNNSLLDQANSRALNRPFKR